MKPKVGQILTVWSGGWRSGRKLRGHVVNVDGRKFTIQVTHVDGMPKNGDLYPRPISKRLVDIIEEQVHGKLSVESADRPRKYATKIKRRP